MQLTAAQLFGCQVSAVTPSCSSAASVGTEVEGVHMGLAHKPRCTRAEGWRDKGKGIDRVGVADPVFGVVFVYQS